MKKRIIQFGAGNIGRSFIGQLFSRGGYEVVFVDVDQELINCLNAEGQYNVIIKDHSKSDLTVVVGNVSAIHFDETTKLSEAIAESAIICTSVGKVAVPYIIPVIAKGLKARFERYPDLPADIIIAENIRNAPEIFKRGLKSFLPEEYPFDELIGLIETSIGKMVPIMKQEDLEADRLQVFAEPYNSLIVDSQGFKSPIPEIEGLAPKDNIKAWVDRKLFIHNLGHAATAYFANHYFPDLNFCWEALEIDAIRIRVRDCMQEAASALLMEYPDTFTAQHLTNHIDDLLWRFSNRPLGDTIFRVGRDLYRKLGKDDRLAGALLLARKHNLRFDTIARAYLYAVQFDAGNEDGARDESDIDFAARYGRDSLTTVLQEVSGFSVNELREKSIINYFSELEENMKSR